MARPIPKIEDLNKFAEQIKPKKSIIDLTVDTIKHKSTKHLVLGTITAKPRPPSEEPKPAVIPKPEPYRPDEPFEKSFLPAKPVPHPPNISPASIPNPNPSVTANKEGFPNYTGFLYNIPGYSAFQPVNYSNNQQAPTPMQTEPPKVDIKPFTIAGPKDKELEDRTFEKREETLFERREDNLFERREENLLERREESKEGVERKEADTPKQQDFEDNFTMQIIPSSKAEVSQPLESQMCITSLAQGSGGSVVIPTQINKEGKKKLERYSLKTSIPISKIDMKCVNTPVDTAFQNATKKPVFNPAFQKENERGKLEIQSNIIIKTATLKELEVKDKPIMPDRESLRTTKHSPAPQSNSINTLINAAEALNKNDSQFRIPEPKIDTGKEPKEPVTQSTPKTRPKIFTPKEIPTTATQPPPQRPLLNPVRLEVSKPNVPTSPASVRPVFKSTSSESKPNLIQPPSILRPILDPVSAELKKPNFPNKPPDGGYNEQKNLAFLQNQKQNPTMLLTIQPNPQVLLQRTNFESKNLQAPSRLSIQSNKSEVIADTSPNVVALKRLHKDNGDERDFENLITENQIYGNKIVVKEKSQVIQVTQEERTNTVKVDKTPLRHWKNKLKIDLKNVDKPLESKNIVIPESKNVVIQPNFVYLSNVQFPANLMMIKNNSKICQTTDSNKMKVSPNENRTTEVSIVNNNNVETNALVKKPKPQNVSNNKEIHVLKSTNVLQTLSNNNNKTDVVFQTNQKVIMTPQVVFQVPLVVSEADNKNQTIKEPKTSIQKELQQQQNITAETKPEKVIITCQVDTKVPKILIASIRPKATINKVAEVSTLDVYEAKKRLRRLKHLSHTNKEVPKTDQSTTAKKTVSKAPINVINPDTVVVEILKEFSQKKGTIVEESSESESESDEDELEEYNAIIEEFGVNYNKHAKADFLAGLSLATKEVYREKQLERHERTLKFDAIASAYIAAGRLDPFLEDQQDTPEPSLKTAPDTKSTLPKKHMFLAHFKLMQVSPRYKAEYEKSWREILRERNRRNGVPNSPEPFDPNSQLQMLTEINKSVNENNDLIKRRLDAIGDEHSDIRILAEKNFSELNRLSMMADRSVKLFSGKDMKKRDLNPGFDSENIKKFKGDWNEHSRINVPMIVSLRTGQESYSLTSSQATSMDEPSNSASCGKVETTEVGCQAEEKIPWEQATDVMEYFINNFRQYEIARKKEVDELHRGNTRLRVESAHVTRSASRDSDRARALLAERQHLAGEEAELRKSLDKLNRAIATIKNS